MDPGAELPVVGDDLRCPKCALDNLLEARLCRACGTSLRRECLACGESIRTGLQNCDRCFAPQAALQAVAVELAGAATLLAEGEPARAGEVLDAACTALAGAKAADGTPLRTRLRNLQVEQEQAVAWARAHADKAQAEERRGDFDDAERCWQVAIAADRRHAEAHAAFVARRPAAEAAAQASEQEFAAKVAAAAATGAGGRVAAALASCAALAQQLAPPRLVWHSRMQARLDEVLAGMQQRSEAAALQVAAADAAMAELEFGVALAAYGDAVDLDDRHEPARARAEQLARAQSPERDAARKHAGHLLAEGQRALELADFAAGRDICAQLVALRREVGTAHWDRLIRPAHQALADEAERLAERVEGPRRRRRRIVRIAAGVAAALLLVAAMIAWRAHAAAHRERLADLDGRQRLAAAELAQQHAQVAPSALIKVWDEPIRAAAAAATALALADADTAARELAVVEQSAAARRDALAAAQALAELAPAIAAKAVAFEPLRQQLERQLRVPVWTEADAALRRARAAVERCDVAAAQAAVAEFDGGDAARQRQRALADEYQRVDDELARLQVESAAFDDVARLVQPKRDEARRAVLAWDAGQLAAVAAWIPGQRAQLAAHRQAERERERAVAQQRAAADRARREEERRIYPWRTLQEHGFEAVGRAAVDPQLLVPTRIRHRKTGAELVLLPAGDYVRGSPAGEADRDSDERPHRCVVARPFYLGVTEVTQDQWRAVMASNPSRAQGPKLPVENVTYLQCLEFLGKAGRGLRLPSEAEWEYACRAGATTAFAFGPKLTPEQANFDASVPYANAPRGLYRRTTVAAGSLPANAFGLHEMHGNVWEWCADGYAPYTARGTQEPAPATSKMVVRGGGWNASASRCRAAFRGSNEPTHRGADLGLRLALSVPEMP